jgi:predicted Zn-dependent peptidase
MAKPKMVQLDNGATAATDVLPFSETVCINATFCSGSGNETENEHGVAHFLEHMMFRSGNNKTIEDFQNRIDMLGGSINASTDEDTTVFRIVTLKENTNRVIDLLGQLLTNTSISEEEVELERTIILEELRNYNNSNSVLQEGFLSNAYGDHPVTRPIGGSKQSVEAISAQQLAAFRKKHYTRQNLVIGLAGEFDESSAIDAIETSFANLPRGQRATAGHVEYFGGETHFPCPCERGSIMLGFHGCSARSAENSRMDIIAEILGGGAGSRLFQEVREKRGLAYDVSAYTNTFLGQTLIVLEADGHAKNTKDMFDIIVGEMIDMATTTTETELERAKRRLIAQRRYYRDSIAYRVDDMVYNVVSRGETTDFVKECKAISDTTTAEVTKTVAKLLSSEPSLAVHGLIRKMPTLKDYRKQIGSLKLVA